MTTVCSFDGKQRNCGLELATCGDVLSGLRLTESLTFHDADGVPKRAINFGVGWDLPWVPGLSLNGRGITSSSLYLDAANRIEVSGWTRTDVGARYRTWIEERVHR